MTATGSSYSRRTTALTLGASVVLLATCVHGTWGRSIDAEREAEAFFRDCMDSAAASRCTEFTEPAEHATLVRLRDEYAAACGRPSSTSARVVKTRGSVYSVSGGWFSKRHVVEGVVVSERCGTTFELEFATNAGMNLHVIAVRHDSRRLAAAEATPAGPSLSDAEQSASANERALGKLRPYLDCTGDPRRGPARGPATSTIAYLRALPLPTSDPAAISRVPALPGFIEPRACIDELAAISDPEDLELEALGRAWSDALAELGPLVAEASHYYDHEDYLDDGWAKGRLLHPKLVAAAKAFRPADDALRAAIRVRYRAWRERALLRLDAIADRTLGWHERRTFLLAARIDYGDVDILPTGVLDLDVGRFGPTLTNLENQLTILAAYVAERPDALESTLHAGHLKDFQGECEDFERVTKRMLRRKRDNRRFSPAELEVVELGGREAARVEGGVPELEAAFGDVVFAARRAGIPS